MNIELGANIVCHLLGVSYNINGNHSDPAIFRIGEQNLMTFPNKNRISSIKLGSSMDVSVYFTFFSTILHKTGQNHKYKLANTNLTTQKKEDSLSLNSTAWLFCFSPFG